VEAAKPKLLSVVGYTKKEDAKSFHVKADPSQAGFVVSVEWSSMELIRLCRHPSIRTLC
jgi:hypothetical protein